MVEHEAVKVWIVRVKEIGFMQRMEVLDIGGDFHLVRYSVFDNSPEWISSGSLWQWIFCISIDHRFWSDEDEMYAGSRENIGQLRPHLTWKR